MSGIDPERGFAYEGELERQKPQPAQIYGLKSVLLEKTLDNISECFYIDATSLHNSTYVCKCGGVVCNLDLATSVSSSRVSQRRKQISTWKSEHRGENKDNCYTFALYTYLWFPTLNDSFKSLTNKGE